MMRAKRWDEPKGFADEPPPLQTPWGEALTDDELFGGRIRIVTTEEHGGLKLSTAVTRMLPAAFAKQLLTRGWAEEDCEMPIVVRLLWDRFSDADKEEFGGDAVYESDRMWNAVFNFTEGDFSYSGARSALKKAYSKSKTPA